MRPIIYTTPTCGYCEITKQFFRDNMKEYEVIDISENEESRNLIQEKTGMLSVPVIQINDEFIVGFNRQRLSELLGIKE